MPGPGLPWDLMRPHSETGWRHRRAVGCTRNRATVLIGSWCSWKTREGPQLPDCQLLCPETGIQDVNPSIGKKTFFPYAGIYILDPSIGKEGLFQH